MQQFMIFMEETTPKGSFDVPRTVDIVVLAENRRKAVNIALTKIRNIGNQIVQVGPEHIRYSCDKV